MQCKVKSISPLASHTYRILLQPAQRLDFKAGQYVMVIMGEKDKRAFSIANSPCQLEGNIELHIGAAEHNLYAQQVVQQMETALAEGSDITIDAPHGDAWVREDSQRPLLLIAGGTGFSYVRSILDHCLATQQTTPIHLYWGAKDESQLYALEELQELASQYSNMDFIPTVETPSSAWSGKVGNVLQAVMADFESLADFDIYIAGRFDMAGAARDQFTQHKHAVNERMFADAYAFI
ncbi:NAD(P)H-flavin reductase [Vibrio sp. V27_P1S3P104]|nr:MULTISPECIES: NAD(P)H-flavin reductase [unclassified Vibrio]NAX06247.1 NAD(P)H-flavin reductase [Vibrio sp. V30_P3S12P165]NAX33500.1 NAD(P)H-flavin reductase [Vibrio sp. V29_P1S30P107]NAX37508.1 NAD(P)H-flavin reductase [Vibrio sp. V27_P1S3P104]